MRESFIVFDSKKRPRMRVMPDEVIVGTSSNAPTSVLVLALVVHLGEKQLPLEPPVILSQLHKDHGESFVDSTAIEHFSTKSDDSGGYLGPLPAKEAKATFERCLESYRAWISENAMRELLRIRQFTVGD